MKYLKAVLAFCGCLAMFTACRFEETAGFDLPIFVQAPVQYEWAAASPETEYSKNSVIFTGTVLSVRETTLNYEYLDARVSDPITVFEMEITEVLSCRSGSYMPGDTVKVGVGYNSSTRVKELPIIKEGSSYLVFSSATADREKDAAGLADKVELWVSNAKDLLIEKTDGSYLTTEFFSDAPGAALSENGRYLIASSALEEHVKKTALQYEN